MKYSRTDLARVLFGISPAGFSNKKEKYLAHLSEYYEWHMEGRSYVLDKELKPWEPLKRGRSVSKDKIQEDYIKAMHEIVDDNPSQSLNSGSNLTRNAKAKNPNKICNRYNHQVDTMNRYFCRSLDAEYPTAEKTWAKKKNDFEYEELTLEEREDLQLYIQDTFPSEQVPILSVNDVVEYAQKEKTKAELHAKMDKELDKQVKNFYEGVLSRFKQKYGFMPVLVRKIDVKKMMKFE